MNYDRMKYAHDQREWVRVADEQLPALRARASDLQNVAATWFKIHQHQPFPGSQKFTSEAYAEAIMWLNRVLYYEGMKRANLPKGEA